MKPPSIIAACNAAGVTLNLTSTGLKMSGPTHAIEQLKPAVVAAKKEVVAYLTHYLGGALLDPDGGYYLPWGPYLNGRDVHRLRVQLLQMIEEVADIEGWEQSCKDNILERALRGPLSDLMPNVHHFTKRLRQKQKEK
jgi:hypothetical protein